MTDDTLLEIKDLHLAMRSFEGEVQVLNGVSFAVKRGEIWGIVGETGSGKSLTGLSVSRLVPTPPGRYLGAACVSRGATCSPRRKKRCGPCAAAASA
ncbi:ATP-binding cassette domain-containing protein [Pseudoroseomonas wenyumeiae]